MASDKAPVSAATRTLDVVELAEPIILNFEMGDILKFRWVSKYTKQLLEGSIAIQRALHLVAQPGERPERLMPKLPDDRLKFDWCGDVIFKIEGRSRYSSALSSRMLLTQPPIREVNCSIALICDCKGCRSRPDHEEYKKVNLEREAGITLAELATIGFDSLRELSESCERCRSDSSATQRMEMEVDAPDLLRVVDSMPHSLAYRKKQEALHEG